MTLTATGRAVTAASVGAQSTAGDSRTSTPGCYATEAAMEIFVSARGVTQDQAGRTTIMEPLMAAAAEPTDMLRVGRSGGYRLTAAIQRESIKIGRSPRASLASVRHVAAQSAAVDGVDARTQPCGESATPGQAEEAGDVLPALAVVDDCGRRRVSDVGLDSCQGSFSQ
jgi:hypothetical protein